MCLVLEQRETCLGSLEDQIYFWLAKCRWHLQSQMAPNKQSPRQKQDRCLGQRDDTKPYSWFVELHSIFSADTDVVSIFVLSTSSHWTFQMWSVICERPFEPFVYMSQFPLQLCAIFPQTIQGETSAQKCRQISTWKTKVFCPLFSRIRSQVIHFCVS